MGVWTTKIRFWLTNLRENEKLAFPLVLIEGTVENVRPANLSDLDMYVQAVAHEVNQGETQSNSWVGSVCWPVVRDSGHFKAYVHLPRTGTFRIRLRIATTTSTLTLRFVPRRTKWILRFHYQKPRESHHDFDVTSGVGNADSDACERLKFNALLLQTAVAELFHRAGLSRKTFALELDGDGFPIVSLLRSKYSSTYARRMSDPQLLSLLHRDVKGDEQQDKHDSEPTRHHRIKHVVIMDDSHLDPRTGKAARFKALLGGDVVASSACNMHTWPRGLEEFTACCINSELVAPGLSVPHCAVRRSFWANYSGGLSVLLQLLGLSFGLRYRTSGVMHKSFREFTRLFTVFEPRSGMQQSATASRPIGDGRFARLQLRTLKPVGLAPEGAHLDDLSIGELALQCRWINPNTTKRMHAAMATAAVAA
ncbi:hypothetical protein BBJ28_00006127 [Nothophytophthora sp. Chile5]|nr:hypothetical protein BBJ28_00006127 [Nothophytophthora sp. Chile5]